MNKACIECGSTHWTPAARCPACLGVRNFHRDRLSGMGFPFSERAFGVVYGPEGRADYPGWCCRDCGAEIGYLGRFIDWLLHPVKLHRCRNA